MPSGLPSEGADAQERWLLAPETLVDHFRIMRPLGRGGMAEVYLARDTKLGRKVALKIIRREALGSEAAAERFLFEARATARFDHPHIVTVYDVGEHEGRPYVALQYLEGQSLRERMAEGPLGMREAVRIGLAVAEALKEAHNQRLLHRDLKPENVMLGSDGRVRVVDFGLAGRVGARLEQSPEAEHWTEPPAEPSTRPEVLGTPAYMAPEQWQEEETSGATDVWALGIILYEMLAGRRPYEAPSPVKLALAVCSSKAPPPIDADLSLPGGLAEAVARCLARDPAERPVAGEVVDLLQTVLHPGQRKAGEADSPFRGLLPFGEQHSHLFFGREAEVAAFIERMRSQCLLPVVGPSGAGKSSFVQAGVIPRLREKGAVVVLSLRPGSAPFAALAARIVSARKAATPDASLPQQVAGMTEDDQLARQVRASPQLLNLVLHRLAKQRKAQVVLFVDQLEELWALVPDEAERKAFLLAISTAADDPAEPVRVIFTMREEFLSRLGEAVGVSGLIGRFVVLGSMGEAELSEVLCRPLQAVGYGYDDPGLVTRMIAEVQGEPACLPLLQFAGSMLWEGRDRLDRKLLSSTYAEMGGVGGALARHADGVLNALNQDEIEVARSILLRLVTAEGMRRAMERGVLLEGLPATADAVLRRLIEGRLVTIRRSEHDEGSQLELVHESLVVAWARLKRWLDESRDERAFLDQVGQAADLWDKRGRRDDEVWQGEALREAKKAAANCTEEISERIREFLSTGLRKERRRSLARRALYATVLLFLLAFASLLWLKERETALERDRSDKLRRVAEFRLEKEKQAEAESARALAQSRQNLAGVLAEKAQKADSADEGLLYAAAALEQAERPDARGVLSWLTQQARPKLLWQSLPGRRSMVLDFSPDGKLLAASGGLYKNDGAAIFEVESGEQVALLEDGSIILTLQFSPAGDVLYTVEGSGKLTAWNTEDWTRLWNEQESNAVGLVVIDHGQRLFCGGQGPDLVLRDAASGRELGRRKTGCDGAYAVGRRGDGRLLFACRTGKDKVSLQVWDGQSGSALETLKDLSYPMRVALDEEGKRLAVKGQESAVRILDAADGRALVELQDVQAETSDMEFSKDGRWLYLGGRKGLLGRWDTVSGKPDKRYEGQGDLVLSLALSEDQGLLASAGAGGDFMIHETGSGRLKSTAWGHPFTLTVLSLSPDGERLFSGGQLLSLALWNTRDGKTLKHWVQPGFMEGGFIDNLLAGLWSADGASLVTGTWRQDIFVWDALEQTVRKRLHGHQGMISALAESSDGKLLASGSHDKSIRLWTMPEGDERRRLEGHRGEIRDLAFSPDGKILASAAVSDGVWLWDVEQGKRLRVLSLPMVEASSLAFSPDGRSLVIGDLGRVMVLDLESDRQRAGGWNEMKEARWVGMDARARYLLAVSKDACRVWDLKSGALRADLPGGYRAAMDARTDRLFVGDMTGVVRAWDISALQHAPEFIGHRQLITYLQFSPDGRRLWSISRDKSLRQWDVATGRTEQVRELSKVAFLTHLSADGKRLLTEPALGDLAVLDWETGRELARFSSFEHNLMMSIISRDGRLVAGVNQAEGARLFSVETGKEIPLQDEAKALVPVAVAFSADGRVLAITGPENQSGPIRLVDTRDGRLMRTIVAGVVPWKGVAFSPDGQRLVASGNDKVLLFQVADGSRISQLEAVGEPVEGLLFSPDGRLVAGRSLDTTYVWQAENGRLLATLDWSGHLTFSPDSRLMASADDENRIRLLNLEALKMNAPQVVEQVRQQAGLTLDGLEVKAVTNRLRLRPVIE